MEPGRTAQEYCRRGLAHHACGDLDLAVADFDRAIEVQPDAPEAWNNRGAARQALGDVSGALADFDRALALWPSYAEAFHNRGFVRLALGDAAASVADFDRALALRPRDAAALESRARARRALGDPEGAVADLDRAIGIRPDRAELYDGRAAVLMVLGDREGALADYDRALRLAPPPAAPLLLVRRAGVHVARLDFVAARADLDRAIALDPGACLAFVSRANVRHHQRDPAGLEDYRTAFRIDPAVAAADLIRLLSENVRDDPDGVLENCRQHVRICPADPVAYARRGLTLLLLDRIAEAERDLDHLRGRFPDPELLGYVDRLVALARPPSTSRSP